MNWSSIETALSDVAAVVEKLAPLASAIPGVGTAAAGIIGAGATFASEALTALENEQAVISATDLASIQASAAKIQAANDTLAATIAGS